MLHRIQENGIYKLLALGFAIALHFYANNLVNPHASRVMTVSVSPRNAPANAIWNDRNAPTVAITVEGPADDLARVAGGSIEAYVDLHQAEPGKSLLVAVRTLITGDAENLTITDCEPRIVSVVLDPVASRRLPIMAVSPGTPPPGYAFRVPEVTPAQATVSGSAESVDAIDHLQADIGATSASATVDESCSIDALDAQGNDVQNVTLTPPTAHVHISLIRVPAAKVLYVNANLVGAPAFPYRVTGIQVSPQTLTVEGRPETLNNMTTVLTDPIPLTSADSDITTTVHCVLPPGVSCSENPAVTVTVHIQPVESTPPANPPHQGVIPAA